MQMINSTDLEYSVKYPLLQFCSQAEIGRALEVVLCDCSFVCSPAKLGGVMITTIMKLIKCCINVFIKCKYVLLFLICFRLCSFLFLCLLSVKRIFFKSLRFRSNHTERTWSFFVSVASSDSDSVEVKVVYGVEGNSTFLECVPRSLQAELKWTVQETESRQQSLSQTQVSRSFSRLSQQTSDCNKKNNSTRMNQKIFFTIITELLALCLNTITNKLEGCDPPV